MESIFSRIAGVVAERMSRQRRYSPGEARVRQLTKDVDFTQPVVLVAKDHGAVRTYHDVYVDAFADAGLTVRCSNALVSSVFLRKSSGNWQERRGTHFASGTKLIPYESVVQIVQNSH